MAHQRREPEQYYNYEEEHKEDGIQLVYREEKQFQYEENDQVEEGCFAFLTHLLFGPKLRKTKRNKKANFD
jgi:hypothetical protein